MLLSACVLLVALVTTTQVEVGAAASTAAEAVMERPTEARVPEARGVEEHEASGRVTVAARQGMPGGGRNVFSLTLNALNPVPYLMGGINGVRQVMHQRLHPFHSMNSRYIPRQNKFRGGRVPFIPLPERGKLRIPPGALRYGGSGSAGGGGGGLGDIDGGVDYVEGGAAGGSSVSGMHEDSHNLKTPDEGFLRQVRGAQNEQRPLIQSFSSFPNPQRPFTPPFPTNFGMNLTQDFGTLKPQSIMTDRPNFRFVSDNITFLPTIPTTAVPRPKIVRTEAASSGAHGSKLARIINIRVPEEMQDLAILEISMKANGDISLNGGHEEKHNPPHVSSRRPRPPGSVKSSNSSPVRSAALLPSLSEIFAEEHRLHELDIDNEFPDPIFRRDVETVTHENSDIQNFLVQPYGTSPSQDTLGMQTAENTNPALLSALPIDWGSISSFQPIVISNKDMHNDNYQSTVPLPNLFPKSNPVASFQNFPQNSNMNNFYLVPLGMAPSSLSNNEAIHRRPLVAVREQQRHVEEKNSAVYYIDITIPGNPGGMPSVNAKRLTRRRRSLEFDGWFPMDVSNPMSDDPTVAYQPPPLERVRFSNDPVFEKPLYPVRPENPTVFVVRSELQEPEYHSVYGTENVEYYHINPQSNTVRAFRSPSFSLGEATLVPAQTDATTPSTTPSIDEDVDESSRGTETNLEIPKKEEGFSDKSDNLHESTKPSDTQSLPKEEKNCEIESESDMESAFSELRSSVIERPDLLFLLRDKNKKTDERADSENTESPRRRTSLPRRRYGTTSVRRNSDPPSSTLPLYELLGHRPRESQIEESPYLGSATDSAGASLVQEIPPPNFRYSSQRTAASRHSPVSSRPRVRTDSLRNPVSSTRPWYLIDTRSSGSSRGREPSIASYIIPETFSGGDKVHYKPHGPVSYVNKQEKTLSDLIDNPHLDDHMNSYKPTLTANSLSELLQIFRFTQVTGEPDGGATEVPVTMREFRYTRPTDETPTTDILPSSFRYTPSPSKFSDPTTEAGITEKPSGVYSDAVADTNSLDGYLFSDSEASPDYANPRVRSNVVVSESKNASQDKGAARGTSKVKINSNLLQRNPATPETLKDFQIIHPGPAPSRKTSTSSPQYVIYQGHSKVKVFGVNSAEDDEWSIIDMRDMLMAPAPTSASPTTTTAPPTSITSSLPRATTSSVPTPSTFTPIPNTSFTLSSTVAPPPPVEQSTTASVTDFTLSHTTEDLLPTTVSEEYDYYYAADEYGVTDLAFGDYQAEGLGQPLIYAPDQLPPPPSVPHLPHPPPDPLTEEAQDADTLFDHSAVRDSSRLEDSFPHALTPAVALTLAELSVDRPVVTIDEQLHTAEDNKFSHPSTPITQYGNSATVNGTTESDKGA